MQIDFSQMHCGRDEVRERMERYIDFAANNGLCRIDKTHVYLLTHAEFISLAPSAELSNHEFFLSDEGRRVGIDTPEELKQILSQWGYL